VSRRLLFRPAAVADLDAIWTFTADRWGVAQADAYVRELHDACAALSRRERVDQDASGLRPGYRKLRCGRHVIFHRAPDDGSIEIVRILHDRMDVEARLPRD
jgi:toxin ParE1/3/4